MADVLEIVTSAAFIGFVDGEGLGTSEIYTPYPVTDTLGNLYVYNAGPAASLTVGGAGAARNGRNFQVKLNNTTVVDYPFVYFQQFKSTGAVNLSLINTPSTVVTLLNNSTNVRQERSKLLGVELSPPI
jgi:hypothetical protein